MVRDEIGRLPAMLTAERLAAGWRKVTLVTSATHPGEGEGITTSYTLMRALGRLGVEMVDRAKLMRIEGGRAMLKGVFEENRPPIEGVDAVVSVLGTISHAPLLSVLKAAGANVRCIGDARLPRDVTAAVREAADAVWSLNAGYKTEPAASLSPSVVGAGVDEFGLVAPGIKNAVVPPSGASLAW